MATNVNIKSVAQRAGVAIGTASRVLNGHANVRPENVERVQRAVRELNYRRVSVGQLLASRRGSRARTGVIGLVFTGMTAAWQDNLWVAHYLMGLEQGCREDGFHFLLDFLGGEIHVPRMVEDRRVDGLLVKGSYDELSRLLAILPDDLPVVGAMVNQPGLPIAQVDADHRALGWQATAYLWSRGHRRIGFYSHDSANQAFVMRRQGYEEFMRSHGMDAPPWVAIGGPRDGLEPEHQYPDAEPVLRQWWSLPVDQRPTAVVAGNDWTAGGISLAAQSMGLSLPDDLSLIGFDNLTSVCNAMRPALTSHAVPTRQAAFEATRLLIGTPEQASRKPEPRVHLLGGKIVERDSVASIDTP